jgi:hypothetical protein
MSNVVLVTMGTRSQCGYISKVEFGQVLLWQGTACPLIVGDHSSDKGGYKYVKYVVMDSQQLVILQLWSWGGRSNLSSLRDLMF